MFSSVVEVHHVLIDRGRRVAGSSPLMQVSGLTLLPGFTGGSTWNRSGCYSRASVGKPLKVIKLVVGRHLPGVTLASPTRSLRSSASLAQKAPTGPHWLPWKEQRRVRGGQRGIHSAAQWPAKVFWRSSALAMDR